MSDEIVTFGMLPDTEIECDYNETLDVLTVILSPLLNSDTSTKSAQVTYKTRGKLLVGLVIHNFRNSGTVLAC